MTNLLAHWPLSQNAQDATGQHHGSPTSVTFQNNAAHFNGRDSLIQIPDSSKLQLGSKPFTISAWVKCPPALRGTHGDILSKFDTSRRCGLNLYLSASAAAYSSFGDSRHVHFGIDDAHTSPWVDNGHPGHDNPLISTLATFKGRLYAGTTDSANPKDACKVYRWDGGTNWIDTGRVTDDLTCPSVMSMIVHNGALYAGTGSWDWGRAEEGRNAKPPVSMTRLCRYEADGQWRDLALPGKGQRVLSMASFNGCLYIGMDRGDQGRCYKLDGDTWSPVGQIDGPTDNFECLMPVHGTLYGASHFAIFRHEAPDRWVLLARRPFDITQIHSFATYQSTLWAGTWPQGYALRLEKDGQWTNTGTLGLATRRPGVPQINELNALATHNGMLYSGVLPKAEVYRYDHDSHSNQPGHWANLGSLASSPNWDPAVCPTWMRVLSLTTHQGRLFAATGASQARTQDLDADKTAGRVLSCQAGIVASHEHDIPADWTHIAAVRTPRDLKLFINGKLSHTANMPPQRYFDLGNAEPLTIGSGPTATFQGSIRNVRLHADALTPDQIQSLQTETSSS